MNLEDYRVISQKTALYPKQGEYPIGLMYAVLGLNGEAGEVAEEVKKTWRNDGEMSEERARKIFDELGDVLWYAAQVATEMNFNLQNVAEANIAKLEHRRSRRGLAKR